MIDFSSFQVTTNQDRSIAYLQIAREKQKNSMNIAFFNDLDRAVDHLDQIDNLKVVILTGKGKLFSSGLDLIDAQSMINPDKEEVSRKAIYLHDRIIQKWQNSLTKLESLRVPVICAIHNYCIGGAVDLILATDIRFAVKNTQFSIREVDIGLCADLGTIQRLSLFTKNQSLMKELVYTASNFDSQQAIQLGLISREFDTYEQMMEHVNKLAATLAQKSPVAVYMSKKSINQMFKSSVQTGLDYIAAYNSALLQTSDIPNAVIGFMNKKTPTFSKL